jgi:hypothetical protein
MKDRMENLIKKNVVLFTKNRFRFQGIVKGYDGKFLEIFDEIKKKPKLISVDEIIEVEIKE